MVPVDIPSNYLERFDLLRVVTERLRLLARAGGHLPSPEEIDLRHRRAQLLAALGQPELAVREYTRCLLAEPRNSACYGERAALHRQLGNLPAAKADEQAARRVAALAPTGCS